MICGLGSIHGLTFHLFDLDACSQYRVILIYCTNIESKTKDRYDSRSKFMDQMNHDIALMRMHMTSTY